MNDRRAGMVLSGIARDILAMDFPTRESLEEYLRDHPSANARNHHVVPSRKEQEGEKERQRVYDIHHASMRTAGQLDKRDVSVLRNIIVNLGLHRNERFMSAIAAWIYDRFPGFNEDEFRGSMRFHASESRTASATPGSQFSVNRNVRTKAGVEFASGDRVRLTEYTKQYPYLVKFETDDGRKLALPVDRAGSLLPGFPKPPGLRVMEKWSNDGVARAVDGARVEPDGFSSSGAPSWMLVVGVI